MSEIFDRELAIKQAGGSSELARDLHTMLFDELPALAEKLRQAHQDMDFNTMWDHAHKIYGSTAYCGVPALQKAAENLEQHIKDKNAAELTSGIEAVENEVVNLLVERDDILNVLK